MSANGNVWCECAGKTVELTLCNGCTKSTVTTIPAATPASRAVRVVSPIAPTEDLDALVKEAREFAETLDYADAARLVRRLADALEAQRPGREEIAALIAPGAFAWPWPAGWSARMHGAQKSRAFRLADAILALFSPGR